MGIQVRFDEVKPETVEVVSALINKYIKGHQKYLAVKELGKDGTNPHYHVYLELPNTQKANVRAFVKKFDSNLCGPALCVKQWGDGPSDMWYLCKGTSLGKFKALMSSYHALELAAFNKSYWAVNDKLKTNGKVSGETVTQTLVRLCQQQGVTDREAITRVFVESRKGREQVCPFKHRGVILSAYAQLADASEVRDMVASMSAIIFRDIM